MVFWDIPKIVASWFFPTFALILLATLAASPDFGQENTVENTREIPYTHVQNTECVTIPWITPPPPSQRNITLKIFGYGPKNQTV